MMENNDKEEGKSFWSTVPGILTALAALITAMGGIIVGLGTLPRPNVFFPATETATVTPPPDSLAAVRATVLPSDIPVTKPRTEPPANPPVTESPFVPVQWIKDSTGVCRDDKGEYPRWSEYNGWTLPQCQQACQNNPNCQGFAMSKNENYCQLFGSDGQYDGSSPGTQITRGDNSYSQYTCYIKP